MSLGINTDNHIKFYRDEIIRKTKIEKRKIF